MLFHMWLPRKQHSHSIFGTSSRLTLPAVIEMLCHVSSPTLARQRQMYTSHQLRSVSADIGGV